jgi:hypothetical protein
MEEKIQRGILAVAPEGETWQGTAMLYVVP